MLLTGIQQPYLFPAKGCVQTVKCECGWESVHVMPEEHERRVLAMFEHMREAHGLTLPTFTVYSF